MISLTKREVRDALARDAGVDKFSDAEIARWFEISQAAVSLWKEDAPIPPGRVIQAMTNRPDLFGTVVAPADRDENGAGNDAKARAA